MPEVPVLKDEIERKSYETLALWLERYQLRQCSLRDAELALETLYSAVAGLCTKETMNAISEGLNALAGMPADDWAPRRTFVGRAGVMLAVTLRTGASVSIARYSPAGELLDSQRKDFAEADDPQGERMKWCDQFFERLAQAGMKEIV